MGDNSAIEWTDATWNPTIGCTRVSAGCKNCYFMAEHDRRHQAWLSGSWPDAPRQYHVPSTVMQLMRDRLDQPLRWRRPRRIFVNSLSDLFHKAVPDEFIDRVFAVMALAPRHTFQVLTKRPDRMRKYFRERWEGTRLQVEQACERLLKEFGLADVDKPELWTDDGRCKAMLWQWPLPNVWLGTSVEEQKAADLRVPELLRTPAAVRFLSMEPLLGAVLLDNGSTSWLSCTDSRTEIRDDEHDCCESFSENGHHFRGIDWVIVGGESGRGKGKQAPRPMHPEWVRSLRDQCARAGVPFLFKQWGEWAEPDIGNIYRAASSQYLALDGRDETRRPINEHSPGTVHMMRIGKKRAGRLLDGRDHNEFPTAAVAAD